MDQAEEVVAALGKKDEFIKTMTKRVKELLQDRNNLSEDDLAYVMLKVSSMKDERLKACIGSLIGWGDDERAEMETFCAIALEVMANARPPPSTKPQEK